MTRHRKLDVQSQIHRLERRHGDLKERIADLDRRAFLTVQEHLLVTELKKEKLAAKDALAGLRRPL